MPGATRLPAAAPERKAILKPKTVALVRAAGLCLALAAVLPSLHASHFRGGALVPEITSTGDLTFNVTTFWAKGDASSIFPQVTGSVSGTVPVTVSPLVVDESDSRFDVATQIVTSDGPVTGPQTFTINWESCCRIGGIQNASEDSWNLTSSIAWDGRSTTKPIDFNFSSIQPEVVRGFAYTGNLSAVSPVGHVLTYDQELAANITSQPPGFMIDPTTGALSIPAASTSQYLENSIDEPGGDYAFSGNIYATSGGTETGRVQFDWMFDAVATGAFNRAPVVADATLDATVGDTVVYTFVATDPDGDPLTWSFIGQLGASTPIAPFFDPATRRYTWVTTASDPGTYIAQARASDGALTDTGNLTINLAPSDAFGGRVCDIRGEWDLDSSLGAYAPAAPLMAVGFSASYDQSAIIAQEPDTALILPPLGSGAALLLPHGTGPNGGSAERTNSWSLVMDVQFPDPSFPTRDKSLLDTSGSQADGADILISPDGTIVFGGAQSVASPAGAIQAGIWYRIALTCSPVAGAGSDLRCTVYLNGSPVGEVMNPFDGSASLDPQEIALFGDDLADSTVTVAVGNLGFWDRALAPEGVAALGAVAAGPLLPVITVDSATPSGEGSLAGAVMAAEGPTRILTEGELDGQTITFGATDEIFIDDKDIVLDNATGLEVGFQLEAAAETRFFTVGQTSCVQMVGLTMTGGNTGCEPGNITDIGGAILNRGLLIVGDSGFFSCSSCFGGAIFNGASLELRDSSFENCVGAVSGGAVYNFDGAELMAEGTVFSGGVAGFGGGVYNDDAVARFYGCQFLGNTVAECGGGIENYNVLMVEDCILSGNFGGHFGGGITSRLPAGTSNNVGQPVVTILRSTFSHNRAPTGGGLFVNSRLGGPLNRLENTTFHENSTTGGSGGGGIKVVSGDVAITFCTITGNHAETGESTGISANVPASGAPISRVALTNSIAADNRTPPDPPAADLHIAGGGASNPFVSGGGNVVGFGAGVPAFVATGDLTGVADPMLDALGSGVRRPLFGSPAIDNGIVFSPGFPEVDQSGLPRIRGAAPDSGAAEYFVQIQRFGITTLAPAGTDPATGDPLFEVTWTTVPGMAYQIECSQSLAFESPMVVGPMTAEGSHMSYTLPLRQGGDFLRVRQLGTPR